MNKDAKKMNYAIGPIRKILLTEAVSDGGTQEKAKGRKGTWIRLNETLFAFVEEDQTTIVYNDELECGCACASSEKSGNLLCEHIIAFQDLPNTPQLTIESEECRWLQEYLFSRGWFAENRYLYPSLDEELPEDEASWAPDEEAKEELDPVNEDKPLDIGVGDEPEPKMIERKCDHCGFVSKGYDRNEVIQRIAEHRKTCPKNPANKKKTNAPEKKSGPKPTDAKSAPAEKPPKNPTKTTTDKKQKPVAKDSTKTTTDKKQKPPQKPVAKDSTTDEKPPKKYTCEICGTAYNSADDVLNCIERCKEAQELSTTKALVAQDTISEGETWTDAQLEVMRKTVAANATPEEFAYFLNVAKYSGLNPFLKEIYFVKNEKGQTTIITGRDGYLTITKRDPRFEGIQSMEVCETDIFEMSMIVNEDGTIRQGMTHQISNFKDRGVIIGAWARGKMQGEEPVIIFASMSEYDKSKNPMGGKVWKQYPSSMIRKVAESMVLKRIAGISGLVTEAEIGGSELVTIERGE